MKCEIQISKIKKSKRSNIIIPVMYCLNFNNLKCFNFFTLIYGIVFCSTFILQYHISDMIPVALLPRVAGDGLTRSLFILRIHSTVHCVSYLTGINSYDEPSQGISN